MLYEVITGAPGAGSGTGDARTFGGTGLAGMRERVAMIGGRVDTHGDSAGGFESDIAVPAEKGG